MLKKMLKKKNGAEMSLNVIIIAVICLIVLVVLIVIFAMNSGKFSFGVQDCAAKNGVCKPNCNPDTDGTLYAPLPSGKCTSTTDTCCLPLKNQ